MIFLFFSRELLKRDSNWTYYSNLAGTELPLLNYTGFNAFVERAKGKEILESYPLPGYFLSRVNKYHKLDR